MTAVRRRRIPLPERRPAPVLPVLLLVVAVALAASSLLAGPVGRVGGTASRPVARVSTAPIVAAARSTPTSVPTSTSTTSTSTSTSAPPPVPVPGTAPPAFTTGCADAVAYVAAHAAPGYQTTCAPHSALGHYGYTCANVPGRCDGVRIIRIACPAPFVYMNEAHNSWTVIGQGSGIDPYGQGSAAEQSACGPYR